MKKSTKLLLLALALLSVRLWFPQLFGQIRWKTYDNKPADLLSQFWGQFNSTIRLMQDTPQDIKFIKFSNGSEFNHLVFIASDSLKVMNPYPENFDLILNQDTLLVELHPNYYKQESYFWIKPDVQLLFESCDATVKMGKNDKNSSYATQKPILASQNSHVQFLSSKDSIITPNTNLEVHISDRSYVILYHFSLNNLQVKVDNSQLDYGFVNINQIDAEIKGHSIINSINKDASINTIGKINKIQIKD
ncbi:MULTISPECIES: hypothetical protein [unclassified Sphingobacterium]|uniref:hypothetical protein n=1 Tax=unclassified Sphingobacterium TaxID=2609468 RepID=UPI0010540F19|nr:MULTISPECIES: hypothetical protein [unclassified Sphingobacterium]MCS3554964.1 hypothetical protein [Sphingobacterium sp. JUb21]TCR05639.1 hypothetical protein EDF66_106107 [Sphingobacterium sp. JUb20]